MVSAKSFALLTLVGVAAAMPGPVYLIDRRVVRRDGGSQKEGGSGSDNKQYCVLFNLDTQIADEYAGGVIKQICPSFGGKAEGGYGPCGYGITVACIGGQMTKSQDFAKEFNKKAQEADPEGNFWTSCYSADGNSVCGSDFGCKTFPPESSSDDESSC